MSCAWFGEHVLRYKHVSEAFTKEGFILFGADMRGHGRITFGFGKSMLDVGHWIIEHAGEMTVPVLLLHGKADSIAYISSSIEFAAASENLIIVLSKNIADRRA
jgi:alpha-beta hydrolase superfamily lysophospholipase